MAPVKEGRKDSEVEDEEQDVDDAEETEQLGDAGKVALDRMKRARRNAEKKAAEAERKLKEREDAEKSEVDRLKSQLAEAQAETKKAQAQSLKFEVALAKAPAGMKPAQIRKFAKRLTGDTQEELEEDADDLFEDYVPADKGEDVDDSRDNGKPSGGGKKDDFDPFTGRGNTPKEKLTPGAVPGADADDTPEKIAEKILKEKAF